MKRREYIIIAFVAFIVAILSIVLSNVIFGTPQKHPIKVPVVEKMSSTFPTPASDNTYEIFFNKDALNPTQLIEIGGGGNTQPFQGGLQ